MKKIGFLIGIVLVFVSCSSPRVIYDYDQQQEYTSYKSYNYFPEMTTGMNELDDKRLIRQTDSVLQTRGFIKSEQPDLYINIKAALFEDVNRNTVGVGVGGGGRNVGGGISIGLPIGGRKVNQELIFDVIDAKKDALIWQAISEGNFKENASPEKKELYFKIVVEKVFSQYPPKK